jgi:acyl dehydratase
MNDHSRVYRVQARNLSHASENKIHDDEVARRFGFRGALVPGVEVYAYMAHLPVARWGSDWLARGTAECRFLKPVYDGNDVTVTAADTGGVLSLSVDSKGERCATGTATLPEVVQEAPAARQRAAIPSPDDRPEATETTLEKGRRLSSHPLHLTNDYLQRYLGDIAETEPLYAREKLVHPALMLRLCNSALKDNVRLGPWIHVASSVRHCGLARMDDSLAAHAEVAANYERNGHRLVELDVLIVANGVAPVAHVRHTAIYRLRSAA